jgi:hypothetical protein
LIRGGVDGGWMCERSTCGGGVVVLGRTDVTAGDVFERGKSDARCCSHRDEVSSCVRVNRPMPLPDIQRSGMSSLVLISSIAMPPYSRHAPQPRPQSPR